MQKTIERYSASSMLWIKPRIFNQWLVSALKTLLEGNAELSAEPGWRSGYRASLEIKQKRARARNGKIAGGLRARRGSSPFPGANFVFNWV